MGPRNRNGRLRSAAYHFISLTNRALLAPHYVSRSQQVYVPNTHTAKQPYSYAMDTLF